MNWKEIEVSRDWSYFILNGKPLYEGRYSSVLKFKGSGLAPVEDETGWHFINPSGKKVIPGPYRKAWGFYCGLSAVEDESGCYHIDESGAPVYLQRFSWCGNFQEDRCTVRDFEGNYFHIKKNGARVYSEKFRYAGDFKDGIACVIQQNGLFKHIDESGKFLYEFEFFDLGVFHKGYATARDKKGWMHIDLQGNPQYANRFVSIEPFYNDCAFAVSQEGNRVVLQKKGFSVEVIDL